ncbi:hypothetical protein WSM22_45960 [Cytophagales bacterium WSM2-2]|nr:hypothetical protein WSM22_45960 [Cytophagales bacterium WSM2-2]
MKNKHFIAGYVIGILFAIIIGFYTLVSASTTPGYRLADFSFVDLNGDLIAPESLQGKSVVINLWATWCGPCIREMPRIKNAVEVLESDSVIFLIASDEPIDRIIRFNKKRDLGLPMCVFKTNSFSTPLPQARPQTYIFDKNGKLVYNRMGAFEWDDKEILEKLRSFLK